MNKCVVSGNLKNDNTFLPEVILVIKTVNIYDHNTHTCMHTLNSRILVDKQFGIAKFQFKGIYAQLSASVIQNQDPENLQPLKIAKMGKECKMFT